MGRPLGPGARGVENGQDHASVLRFYSNASLEKKWNSNLNAHFSTNQGDFFMFWGLVCGLLRRGRFFLSLYKCVFFFSTTTMGCMDCDGHHLSGPPSGSVQSVSCMIESIGI